MMTHKFLAKGALGPLSGFAWPVPQGGLGGAWVEVTGPLEPCARGVHVCRPVDLAHWIDDELWEIEADGEPLEGLDCLVVPRARLLHRVEAWSDGGAQRFAEACIEHAASGAGATLAETVSALLEDARSMAASGYLALASFTAAVAVSRSDVHGSREDAYRRERAWQSAWIADELLRSGARRSP
ncbi:MAG TPA: hypothetical protein VK762_37395 [Polyangiaceae bacterium]|jgi:hypothetical protein|nr:hypothetical protein [Polyangiaceae bacterium]